MIFVRTSFGFVCRESFALAELVYYITLIFNCQAIFRSFLRIFSEVFENLDSILN